MSEDFKITADEKQQDEGVKKTQPRMPVGFGDIPPEIVEALQQQGMMPGEGGVVPQKMDIPPITTPPHELQEAQANVQQEDMQTNDTTAIDSEKIKEGIEKIKSEAEKKQVEVSDEELDRYCECIASGEEYTEVKKYIKGRFVVEFKTRDEDESAEIIARIGKENPQSSAELETSLCKYYLAFAIRSIITPKQTVHIFGKLDERLQLLKKNNMFSGPRYLLLVKGMFDFDIKLESMRERAHDENFT